VIGGRTFSRAPRLIWAGERLVPLHHSLKHTRLENVHLSSRAGRKDMSGNR
jgi:hypothetical protein